MRRQQSHECWRLSLARFSGCSLFDPGWKPESMWRDALRPDAFRWLRRATEVKGGAAWRRDRSHADPRGPAVWRGARGAWRGPTP